MNTCFILVLLYSFILGYKSTDGFKSQFIRLLDIFVLGPLMIYYGFIGYKMNDFKLNFNSFFALLLAGFGASTITYNLKNYLHQQKQMEKNK
jgi:hypothetical protein